MEQFALALLAAELDMLVIQGTVVLAEHVSKSVEPLNLKRFIREFKALVIVGGCASYHAGLHLMRTGAVASWSGSITGQRLYHPGRARHRRTVRPPPSPTWPVMRACDTSTRPRRLPLRRDGRDGAHVQGR